MNRLNIRAPQHSAAHHEPLHVEQSILRTSQHHGAQYSLFAPLHYEPNYAYPLVIWLHGPGDDERQLLRVMPLVSMRNYVSIGPRGPRPMTGQTPGYHFGNDLDSNAAEQAIFDCLEVATEKFHIAQHRIFLAGFQSGGTMAFRVGLQHPRRFAGVLSLGGPFPLGNSPLAYLEEARSLPLFITQGRGSTSYPVEQACDELRLFHSAGMHVTLRQYPCGDELNTQMLHDMNVWLMEQITGVGAASEEDISLHKSDDS